MCGISGFTFCDKDLIAKMNDRIAHRGPDQEGIYCDDHVSLGHRRLSIIDLSEAGRNPMWNREKNVGIVFNGEIYNFQEIREELLKMGYTFNSKTDTEVIIYAYEAWGIECVKKFNGMWAFAIYDKSKGKIFLSRGRVGKKPLYYHYDGKNLIFSSELKGLLVHDFDKTLDLDAINAFMRLTYIPHPLSIFKHAKKLEPGSNLIFDLKTRAIEIYKFWEIEAVEDEKKTEAEWINEIKEIFFDSVNKRLLADRPLGLFLSGGIDSTSVLAAAHKIKGEGLKTFTIRFDSSVGSEKYNYDADMARRTSKFYGTDHTECTIGGQDIVDNIEKVVYHMGEPISNATWVATYLLAKKAKEKVTVILGGDGGDEIFGGYEKYKYSMKLAHYAMLPRPLRTAVLTPALKWWFKGRKDLSRGLDPLPGLEWYLFFQSEPERAIAPLFLKEMNRPEAVANLFGPLYFEKKYSAHEMSKKIMLTDIQTWLTDEEMMRTDKMSMAWGIEQRCPFLDYRLVNLSTRLPTSLKIKHGELKYILKKTMHPYLPPFVVEANKIKRGFLSPTSKWLRDELRSLAHDLLSVESLKKTGIFDPVAVSEMFERHVQGQKKGELLKTGVNYSPTILWSLMIFQIWYRQFMTEK